MHGNSSYHPLVSVIIPNYNHAPFLKERIDSVLNQTYQNIEVILLDDCSIDNSREIIETYRGNRHISHIVYNEVNSGSTFLQWKKGLDLAQGMWIWIAESDDVADPHFISELLVNSEAEILYCNSKIIDTSSQPTSLYGFTNMPNKESHQCFAGDFTMNASAFLVEWMLRDNFIPNASAVLFKKSLLSDRVTYLKRLHEMGKMKLAGDWYFWLTLLLKSSCISYHARSLNAFRQHSSNVRLRTTKNSFTELHYILTVLKEHNLPTNLTVDTYLYRYFHRNKDTHFTFSEKLTLWKNAWRFGFLGLYIKNVVKYR